MTLMQTDGQMEIESTKMSTGASNDASSSAVPTNDAAAPSGSMPRTPSSLDVTAATDDAAATPVTPFSPALSSFYSPAPSSSASPPPLSPSPSPSIEVRSTGRKRKPSQWLLQARESSEALAERRARDENDRQRRAAGHRAGAHGTEADRASAGGVAASSPTSPASAAALAASITTIPKPCSAIAYYLIIYHQVDKHTSAYYTCPATCLHDDEVQLLNSLHGMGATYHPLAQSAFERVLRKHNVKQLPGSPLTFGKQYSMTNSSNGNKWEDDEPRKKGKAGKGFHSIWTDKYIVGLYDISFFSEDPSASAMPSATQSPSQSQPSSQTVKQEKCQTTENGTRGSMEDAAFHLAAALEAH